MIVKSGTETLFNIFLLLHLRGMGWVLHVVGLLEVLRRKLKNSICNSNLPDSEIFWIYEKCIAFNIFLMYYTYNSGIWEIPIAVVIASLYYAHIIDKH